MNRQVILATREPMTVTGDVSDLAPDLSTFGITGPVAMRPLPLVHAKLLPEHTNYRDLGADREFLEERREHVAEILKSIRKGATVEKVMEKYGRSQRQAFRYFRQAGLPPKHRRRNDA